MRILSSARYTNLILTSGFTAYMTYSKTRDFLDCRQMLEEKKDNSLLLPPPIISLVNEVFEEMKLKQEDKSKIKLFFSETSDFVRLGTINNPYGVILGIPHHFVVDERTVVKLSALDKKNKNEISDIRSLSLDESLHLSYEAKKFAVARELYELLYSNHDKVNSLPLLINVQFLLFSYLAEIISRKRMKNVNYLFHAGLFLTGAILSILLHNLIIFYTETNADFLACDLGKSYINGGIEYYSKMIKRNKELKKINNDAPYSKDGDVNYYLFGIHHIPLQKRLIYLRDHNLKKEKPSIWDYILFPY